MNELRPYSVAEQLSDLIQIRTVSAPDERDEAEFERFRQRLAELYPNLHRSAERVELPGGSLLFRLPGQSADRPLVLMAHYDVVPAPAEGWQADPFGGLIADGCVHGRGALDDKGSLVGICAAVEQLLGEDWKPAQDVYLSFGADEEVFGSGAPHAVNWLREQCVEPWLVLDEGGAVVDDAFPLTRGSQALIAIVEKGTVDVTLMAAAPGGHASTPAPNNAVTQLARAITAINDNPAPARLSGPVITMLQAMAQVMPFPLRSVLARAELIKVPLAILLSRLGPETAATVRTTMAVTRVNGSEANNVIASQARANVNVRLAVDDDLEQLRRRIEDLVSPFGVQIESMRGSNPPPISRTDHEPWRQLLRVLRHWEPELHPVPYVQNGGTDSRHFTAICDAVYRFAPLTMSRAQRTSVHAENEFVTEASLERAVQFYRTLLTVLW